MENKKEYCEKLYNRYRELKEKSKLTGYDKQTGKKCRPNQVTAENIRDIKELKKVQKKLEEEKCLYLLSDSQLTELLDPFCDTDFNKKVEKVLVVRRTTN